MDEACGFRVGDRVELVVDLTKSKGPGKDRQFGNKWLPKGTTGVIKDLDHFEGYTVIGVEWDIEPQGLLHNCYYTCKNGTGWYVRPEFIRLQSPPVDSTAFLSLLSAERSREDD